MTGAYFLLAVVPVAIILLAILLYFMTREVR